MSETPLMKLDLRSPLVYALSPALPPTLPPGIAAEGEILFCFEINPEQGQSIEPEPGQLLGALVFSASTPQNGEGGFLPVELPAGKYLFSQQREALSREDCIAMAVEQQKDGLWERLQPENRLYIRYLFEDGKFVTQVFRPLTNNGT